MRKLKTLLSQICTDSWFAPSALFFILSLHYWLSALFSKAQAASAPTEYVRRQTLKNAERFITPELKTFEDKALSSKSRALAREKHLYDELLQVLLEDLLTLQQMSKIYRGLQLSAVQTLMNRKTLMLVQTGQKKIGVMMKNIHCSCVRPYQKLLSSIENGF